MKDKLEDFVRKNRDAFDDKEPSGNVWKGIEAGMTFKNKGSLWSSIALWRAAAIIFMAVSGYLLYSLNHQQPRRQDVALNEFADVEKFYFEQISEKTALIEDFKKNDGMNGFTNDFKQLEAMYDVLKEEIKNHPSQKVKDALVLNLLVRIDLLNQELHKLEKERKPEEKEAPAKNV
jgi:hypothetical protein